MSTNKGYPSQKKLVNPVDGDVSVTQVSVPKCEFNTVQPIGIDKNGADSVPRFVYKFSLNDEAEAGSTNRKVVATAHGARVGDVIRFKTGVNSNVDMAIIGVPDANTMYLGGELIAAPTVGDDFDLFRYIIPQVDSDGNIQTSSGPIQFVLDGTATTVEEDTAVVGNTIPLPVKQVNSSGVEVSALILTELGDIETELNSINTKLTDVNTELDAITAELVDANISLGNIDVSLNSLETEVTAIKNTLQNGKQVVDTIFYQYSGVNNSAWTQIEASTASQSNALTLFESGGYAMELGIGAAASETRLMVIPPGGLNGEINIAIPAGSRLSVRCLEAQTVSVGYIVCNLLGV